MLVSKCGEMFPSGLGYQLWLLQNRGIGKQSTAFIDPFVGILEERNIPEMQGKLFFCSFEEWLLLLDKQTNECFFLSLISLSKIHLPPLLQELNTLRNCCLSSPVTSADCTVIFVGLEYNFLLYCKPNDKQWTKLVLESEDNGQYVLVDSSIYCKGKLYVSTLHNITFVLDEASLSTGNIERKIIEEPELCCTPCSCRKMLVESCGDVFLVRLYNYGRPINFDIHQLKPSDPDLAWKRVESIGEHAFFLNGSSGISMPADEGRVKSNCIYGAHSFYSRYLLSFTLNLEDQTIVTNLSFLKETRPHYPLCWVLPIRQRSIISETSSVAVNLNKVVMTLVDASKKDLKSDDISRQWADLPLDLVEFLFTKLSWTDCLHLRAACKAWSLVCDPMRKAQLWPLLLHSPNADGSIQLFDPLYNKEYHTKVEAFSSSENIRFLFSKDGWVVVLKTITLFS